MKTQERNWGIDLLRVLCMLSLVIQHVLGHGWITQQINPEAWKYSMVIGLQSLCLFGISGFALISGYVGIHSRYRYSTLIVQWLKVLFYSLLFCALYAVIVPGSIGTAKIVEAFFPVLNTHYWYFTAYIGCFIMMPVLRAGLNALNKKQATACVIGMVTIFSFVNILHGTRYDPFYVAQGKNTLWLMLLYVLGAYLAKYEIGSKLKTRTLAVVAALCCVLAVVIGGIVQDVWSHFSDNGMGYWFFHRNDSPTTLLVAVSLLLLFSRLKLRRFAKVIAWLAPLNFSVYLIHDNIYFRRLTISKYCYLLAGLPTSLIVPAIVLVGLAIYLVCVGIDALREKLFQALGVKQKLSALENRLIGDLWNE